MLPTCSECKFFELLPQGLLLSKEKTGACRRYPPNGYMVQVRDSISGQVGAQIMFNHIQVPPTDWCGEWEPKGITE